MAEEIYRRKGKEKTKHEEWLEQRNRRLEIVIIEITAENLALKKLLGGRGSSSDRGEGKGASSG